MDFLRLLGDDVALDDASVFVGRRLREHNGSLGSRGAKRTQRDRPWTVRVRVSGFSSRSRALSFERAWQYPEGATQLPSRESRDQPAAEPTPEQPACHVTCSCDKRRQYLTHY